MCRKLLPFAVDTQTWGVVAVKHGDINNDGAADLVQLYLPAGNAANATLSVLLNTGGQFATRVMLSLQGFHAFAPLDAVITDVDGDGGQDIVVLLINIDLSNTSVVWVPHASTTVATGSSALPLVFASTVGLLYTSGETNSMAQLSASDFDSDGDNDLVLSTSSGFTWLGEFTCESRGVQLDNTRPHW